METADIAVKEKIVTNGTEKKAPSTNGHTKVEQKVEQKLEPKAPHKVEQVEVTTIKKEKSTFRKVMPLVFLAILLVGAVFGYRIVKFNQVHESTDDAQVDADISPIIARVGGYVKTINVEENQAVAANAPLITLDAADLEIKVQNAEAALRNAEAAVASAQAAARAASSNVATAEVSQRKTATDLARDKRLLEANAITQQQYDATRAAAESAQSQLNAIQQQAAASASQIAVVTAQVAQRKADLENAQLQLGYATIAAPTAGVIAKKNVEVGQYIQPGQPLMSITQKKIWVTANFKETQIAQIHPGEKVELTADAYPDKVFHGTVESISPATGAKFSLLPPDNSSGNFVKVTQRIPVRILVAQNENSSTPLRAGMSVEAVIETN